MHVYTTEGDFACGFLLDRKISAKYEPGGLLKTLYREELPMAWRRILHSVLLTLSLLLVCKSANAENITLLPVFTGQFNETFESFPSYVRPGDSFSTPLPEGTPILGGLATATSFWQGVSGGYIYQFPFVCTPFCDFWGLAGAGLARVSDGTKGLGSTTTIFKLTQGVSQFGGYWGIGAGGGFPNPGQATLTFLDQSGGLIGTATISYFESFGGILMWNGFESAVPVYQINVDLPNNTALAVDGLRANVAESSSVLDR